MDWRYNTIWREQLPEAEVAAVNFQNTSTTEVDLTARRYVFAAKFKSRFENVMDFPADDSVENLYLGSSNIRTFAGVSRFGRLKRLEVESCRQLSSDFGLSGIRDSLEWLNVCQSKKFSPGGELSSLRNLRVLCLNACGPIDSLEFLHLFPNLLDFRFVDTNVLSGDLRPLLEHPTLCAAGFMNKRHYNLKDSEVDEHLRPKWAAAIEKVYEGPYETYRYIDLGN
jgi:hypothetical protein